MTSLETYKKLREKILPLIGDELLEDELFFLSMISSSKDPKMVLGLARDMKEAGNSLFKKGELDKALEKYGYAGMIIARFNFEEESDRLEFLKLGIGILMNLLFVLVRKGSSPSFIGL
ncbi:Protein TANC1 [Bienertia sinuspersici]